MENSRYQRVQRVRNKVSDFVRNSYVSYVSFVRNSYVIPVKHESLSRTNESHFENTESKVQSTWTFYVSRQLI